MTFRQYKYSLLCFLIIFALFAGSRFLIKGSELPTLIFIYTSGLLYWLALFFFLLYAKNKGITEAHSQIAPAKLLPVTVVCFGLISILYSFTMTVIYKTANTMVYRAISEEEMLARTRRAANDSAKTAEQRLKAAQYYFKYSGQGIIYRDEHDKDIRYVPDDSERQARLNHLETTRTAKHFNRFIMASGVLSLVSGITIVAIYIRSRKKIQK